MIGYFSADFIPKGSLRCYRRLALRTFKIATQAEIIFFLGTTFADLLSGSMRLLPMMMTEPHVI